MNFNLNFVSPETYKYSPFLHFLEHHFHFSVQEQMKMSSLLIITLAAVLFVARVHSLQCYSCHSYVTSDQCTSTATCSSSEPSCMKISGESNGVSIVQKGCSAACVPMDQTENVFGISVKVKTNCCNTNLCNSALSVNINYKVLVASACAIITAIKFVF
ncbi:lymphocyte antigen 6B-like [Protopterus annectens]|uniref:lymphocyte antigen 6B-like n=1 Tax=Protopterus annectens TaxID=7888 RepID=UPI001CFA0071|nr:lymphocyte antigen 6B-like [Protopterus annectens]